MPALKAHLATLATPANQVPINAYAVLKWLTDTHGSARPLTAQVIKAIAESLSMRKVDTKQLSLMVPLQATQGEDGPLAAAIVAANVPNLDLSRAQIFKAGLQMIVGMGINAEEWDYSAVRFYRRATSLEVSTGWTVDFGNKHVSTTKDEKSSRNVAVERARPRAEKRIAPLGMIVTQRSGAIVREETEAFAKEIRQRQKEFTDLHKRLTTYRAESWKSDKAGNQFAHIDHVTFRTLRPYTMFEYEEGKGGEARRFIDFSVSADLQGTGWAVHHLSGAQADNIAVDAGRSAAVILGAEQGHAAVSATTTITDRLR